ncbi:DUF6366 family protein [Macrococcoides caseolyticum]|uniref:Uncharacterized protein n=2 Tax=Staphylococcaceae TaxID=90964 RepID=A0ACC9MPZ9_9STAP|nr:DUF6366 family protein [Macrococcus caseolyticus]PKD97541.1 hypothetical protein CW719_10850 [Macrococcus caseolyticus]PKE38397.1 hypothetical protein CW675_11190 [Macrococcus caseolyticus]PKE52028.1 hypothetical protein CW676_11440 [Macrococcus caseolyticus]PKE55542.1 hypothetical protein CW682_11415 [Macrococcus caseolyticus]PKF18209.1 hypothetical protein CW717_10920 [Macrococcus caseolyticus]
MKKPEDIRENLRKKELENNPGGNLKDSFNRSENSNLQDFTGSMSTKTLGIFIIILISLIFLGWLFLT